ncbi:unnamed protein product, partial [Choristocarpus tenellus]
MFGRRPTLPININLGEPEAMPISTQEYSKQQNIGEMALHNESKATEHTITIYEVGAKVWLHKPHTSADAPNPKLLSSWRGSYEVKERISLVVDRVKAQADCREITIHIAQLKPHKEGYLPEPDIDSLNSLFLGRIIPEPDIEQGSIVQPILGSYFVEGIADHKPGVGRKSPHSYSYRLRFRGFAPASDVWRKAKEIPQCTEMTEGYSSRHNL